MQHIPGRASAEDTGPGHCDAVMSIDAHPAMPDVFVSSGNAKDKTVRVWRRG